MIIDCSKDWEGLSCEEVQKRRRRVHLNGEEIKRVWYVDTDAGILKTYDVLKEGKRTVIGNPLVTEELLSDPDIEVRLDRFISKILRGKIELIPVSVAACK